MLSSKARRELKINQRRILIDSIEIRIPSSHQMKNWGERQLPNGKKVGQVKNSKTVNYKKFTPLRDGLFCERIFGPVNSFVCACGKRQPRVDIKFCEKCEVEYIDQRTRRYRLGYIPLVSPTTHLWYLKGRPSYLSLFLGKRKKRVISLAYCNAYLIEQAFSVITALPHVATRQDHGFDLVSNTIKGSTQTQQFSDQFDFMVKSKAIHTNLPTTSESRDQAFFRTNFFLQDNDKKKNTNFVKQNILSFPIDSTNQSQNTSKVTSFFRFLSEVIDTSPNLSLNQKNPNFVFKKEKNFKKKASEHNVVSYSPQSLLVLDKNDLTNETKVDNKEIKRSALFTQSLQLFSNIAFYVQKQNYNLYTKKANITKQNSFFKISSKNNRLGDEIREFNKTETGAVSILNNFERDQSNFEDKNTNNSSFPHNFVKMSTLPEKKKALSQKQNSSTQNSENASFMVSNYTKYLSAVSESKQLMANPYDRAQSLPFLPTLICKYNLRDELLNFLDSYPSSEDLPMPDYCQIRRWQPLRDVHKFMAEQPFYQKKKTSEKDFSTKVEKTSINTIKESSVASFAAVKSDDESNSWTTKRKVFLFSPYTLSYTLLCQTALKNVFSTSFFESLKNPNKYNRVSNRQNPSIDFSINRLLYTVFPSFFKDKKRDTFESESLFDESYKSSSLSKDYTSSKSHLMINSQTLTSFSIKPLFSPLENEKTIFSHFLLFPQTYHFENIREIELNSEIELQQKEKEMEKQKNFSFSKNKVFQPHKRDFIFYTDSVSSLERQNTMEKSQENKIVNFIDEKKEFSYKNNSNLSSQNKFASQEKPRYRVNGPLNFTKKSFYDSFLSQDSIASGTEGQVQKRNNKETELLSPLELITIREILAYTGGGALEKLLKRFDTQLFSLFLGRDIQDASEAYKQKIALIGNNANRNEKKVLTRLCRRIFRNARRLKVVHLFTKNQRRPEWMMISTLPVLPPDLRPILQMSENLVVASDLNNLYQRVIYRNNRYHKLRFIDFHLVTAIQRLVQDAVDRLIENGKGGSKPFYTPGGRALKSLSDTLKGKKGRFRLNLLGKRVDFSGRSVIVVSPHLKIHECGLPKAIALELYHYFLLRNFMVKRKASSIVIAKKLIKQQKPAIWDMLRDIIYHHPLLLNRAPTLHRLGIQAFQPKLVFGNAILLHPLVCSGFNADFDGDQMGVHLPLCLQARAEAWDLLWSRNNLLSPATGQPVLIPSQDMVLGFYYMTQLFVDRLLVANEKRESHNTVSLRNPLNLEVRGKENTLLLSSPRQLDGLSLQKKLTRIPYAHKVFQSKKLFLTQKDLIHAFQLGTINLHTPIWLKTQCQVENDERSEAPLEIRLNSFGGILQIYSQYKRRKESATYFSSMSIRTTVGRVLVNEIIFSNRNIL